MGRHQDMHGKIKTNACNGENCGFLSNTQKKRSPWFIYKLSLLYFTTYYNVMPSFIHFTSYLYISIDIQIIQFALPRCDLLVFFLLLCEKLKTAVVRQGNFATTKTRYQYSLSTKNYTLKLSPVSPSFQWYTWFGARVYILWKNSALKSCCKSYRPFAILCQTPFSWSCKSRLTKNIRLE